MQKAYLLKHNSTHFTLMYSSCGVVALNAAIYEKITQMMDKNYINKTLKLILLFEFHLYLVF